MKFSAPGPVLVTTELYRGEGADWWYLTPIEGQHVSFYSPLGMREIAGRGYVCFSREPIGSPKRFVLRHLVRPATVLLLRTFFWHGRMPVRKAT